MKICDLTQFYSPVSGGVKRYVSEKARHIRERTEGDEHILVIPGEDDARTGDNRTRTYTIRSPLISRTARYRVLLRLEAVERILETERPDIIECGDPYQLGWKSVHSGAALGIPVVGFYHSHFAEAYVRTVQKFCGATAADGMVELARRYTRALYSRFERTLVPSPALGAVLTAWGVDNVAPCNLGVDASIFHPNPEPDENVRGELKIPRDRTLLLYIGRLAHEKNTHTLLRAFRRLGREWRNRFHLLVIGDGTQRGELKTAMDLLPSAITHLPYCDDAHRLAAYYRAADLFVHPGIQETFGLVTLEAQACGTPVVGIRGSYMDRIILGSQANWAVKNSPAALAAAIVASSDADLKHDPAALHARVAAQYSWEEVFARMFDLYREVIHNYRPH